MKYKIGDRVKIVSKKNDSGAWNLNGNMDCWLGKIMTIEKVCYSNSAYEMIEDNGDWDWYEDMIEGLAEFTKDDLKPCMVVILRDGSIGIVGEVIGGKNILFDNDEYIPFEDIMDDLTIYDSTEIDQCIDEELDIMKVYDVNKYSFDMLEIGTSNRELLWERAEAPKPEEMTLAEVCKALGKEIKIVK